MGPTPSCPPFFKEGGHIVGNVSIHSLRSPPLPFATHYRQCGLSSIIVVGRIFLVLSTDDLFFTLAHQRNIVWDSRAIDRKLLAREID